MVKSRTKMGRPSELTQEVVDCLRELVEKPSYVGLLNEEIYTYLSLKTKKNIEKTNVSHWRSEYEKGTNNELINEFFNLMKKGSVMNKINLLDSVHVGDNGWQSKAWILERKFGDLNLRQISEVKSENTHKIDIELDDEQVNNIILNAKNRG